MTVPEARVNETPLLTVAMPVFNGGMHLRLALLSVLNQTFEDWELLLIDDGSTDASVDGLSDIADSRVHIIRDGQNRGLAARLNDAVDLARGRFFARMDQDDISHPERFALQLQKLLSDPRLDLLGTQCITISQGNEILGALPKAENHDDICARPWLGFYLPHPSWMGRTAWFREHRYASPGPYCCEDQELLMRTYTISRYYVLPKALLAYRLRNQLNWRKAWRTRVTLYEIQLKHFVGRRSYSLALFATVALVLRLGRDLLSLLRQSALVGAISRPVDSGVSKEETDSWYQWMRRLENQRGAL